MAKRAAPPHHGLVGGTIKFEINEMEGAGGEIKRVRSMGLFFPLFPSASGYPLGESLFKLAKNWEDMISRIALQLGRVGDEL